MVRKVDMDVLLDMMDKRFVVSGKMENFIKIDLLLYKYYGINILEACNLI